MKEEDFVKRFNSFSRQPKSEIQYIYINIKKWVLSLTKRLPSSIKFYINCFNHVNYGEFQSKLPKQSQVLEMPWVCERIVTQNRITLTGAPGQKLQDLHDCQK